MDSLTTTEPAENGTLKHRSNAVDAAQDGDRGEGEGGGGGGESTYANERPKADDSITTTSGPKEGTDEKEEVPRSIGLFGGISFIVGTIIGSGIFISPKGIARGSGSIGLAMVNWTICGVVSILGAFCYAELGTVIKQSGAEYVYMDRAYGDAMSYLFSWVNNFLVKPASMATITLTCAQYIMTPLFDDGCGEAPTHIKLIFAIVFLFVLVAINIYSVKLASKIQIIFTVAKLIALAIIIIGGIVKLCQGYTEHLATGFEGSETNPGKIAIGLYSGMWAFDGWNTANYMTEEIINPARNLSLSIVIGVPLVLIVYLLTNISYFTVMSIDEVIASPAVAVTWAQRVIPQAAWIIPIFVAMSTFGTGNGSLFSGGRLIFAAARNDHMPEALAMVHVRTFSPSPAIIFTCILAIVFMLAGDIGILIDFVSFITWGFYGLNMLAVIIFRFKKPYKDYPRVIKNPIIIPILVFLASMFLVIVPIVTDPQIEFLFAAVFIVAGFIFYVPFVVCKIRFRCTEQVTTFFQLYLQTMKPKEFAD